jgi:hypothetical protein
MVGMVVSCEIGMVVGRDVSLVLVGSILRIGLLPDVIRTAQVEVEFDSGEDR